MTGATTTRVPARKRSAAASGTAKAGSRTPRRPTTSPTAERCDGRSSKKPWTRFATNSAEAVNRITAEALKKKAASLGQIKEMTEDPQSGSLTITVEV